MDMPTRRVRKIVEHVISIPEGKSIDAKQFDRSYALIKQTMQEEGVDFQYDDCFHVRIEGDELVFWYPKKDS